MFYEPAFYGQAYNTMVEALLAVPLLKLNVFIPFALSVSTVLLSYSVFWVYTYYFYKKKNYVLAILCMALPILLPTEFQIMICISRGFMPGISFTLFGVYLFLTYKKPQKLILAGFFVTLGFVFNPNASILLSAFVTYYLFKPNITIRYELKYLFLGSLPAITYKIYIYWFYSAHPNYNLHIFPNAFQYSFSNWLKAVTEVYYLFMGLFPVVYNLGCLSILALLILVILIIKKSNKRHEQIAAIAGLCFVIFSFGINKVSDGSGSPFFPYSRMFLGIPVLYIFYLNILQKYSSTKVSPYVIGVIILMVFSFKVYSLPERINYVVKHNTGVVKVFKIKSLCQACDSINSLLKETGSEFLVLRTKKDEINYGCPALISEIITIHPTYERRTWIYKKYMFLESKKFLVFDDSDIKDTTLQEVQKNFYLVKGKNGITLEECYRMKQFELRPYKK